MLRKFKNSAINFVTLEDYKTISFKYFVIQTEKFSDSIVEVEYCNYEDELVELRVASTSKSQAQEDDKITEYRAIVLNNNAFNGKWSGKTLGEVFDAKDYEFIDNAIKNMRNEYIRERIEFLRNNLK